MTDSELCSALTENRADARRRHLVDTARKLFIENGFHATGMAQISEQSGIAVGQIYRDFACKEEIVAAIVSRDCAQLMDAKQLEAAVAKRDRTAIRAWIKHFVEPGKPAEADRLFSEIVAESSRNPRIAAVFLQLQRGFEDCLLKALALLIPDEHRAAQRRALADIIMTFSIGLPQHRLFNPKTDHRPLSDMMRSMIAREIDLLAQPA
jgi:AcrR family transcriptional regulator